MTDLASFATENKPPRITQAGLALDAMRELNSIRAAEVDAATKPKRKSKGPSPTQRSLKHMRALGYTCAIVEHWNSFVKRKQDLYGFIDVLCVKGEDIVGIQTTTGDNAAARVTKIVEHENYPLVCKAIRIVVHGWRKSAAGKWVLREVEL